MAGQHVNNLSSTPSARQQSHLFIWLDRRTGINTLLHEALDEPIPGGARLAYVFGSGLLFLFLSQIITGVFLALYYVPSADHAYTTTSYITKEVTAGSFLRSLHSYGSSMMVIILLLHVTQTFLYGSYKGRRGLLWVSGCFLAFLVMGMAFTGYLLPWDQKAYFATAVGTNIASEIPFVGDGIKLLMRGGAAMGTLTLSRFFVAHILFIPGLIFAFVTLHVYLFRRAGAAGPISEDPIAPRQNTESFYPRQLLFDLSFVVVVMAVLGVLAHIAPTTLGPRADPADTQYLPRPEWYYLPIFQWLKYWHGGRAVVGIIIVPLIFIGLFVGLPVLDRGLERRPRKRPIVVSLVAAIFLSLMSLGALSYRDDHRDPSMAKQLAKQREQSEQIMHKPFKPESSGSSPAPLAAPIDSLAAQGKAIYQAQACNACHGDGGLGTTAAPPLVGIAASLAADQLAVLLRQPTETMRAGGMPAVKLNNDEMNALIAYLDSLN